MGLMNKRKKNDIIYNYLVRFVSPQVIKEYIKFENNQDIKNFSWSDLYSFSEKYDKDYEILKACERLEISVYKFSKWMTRKIDNFNMGVLPTSEIEKLKMIGFFEDAERFNDEDLKTVDFYFKNIDDTRITQKDMENGNWQLKIAKYFVMNYYYRKPNQSYELSDYINEIIVNAINFVNEQRDIDIPKLERYILDKIKEFNEKNMANKLDYMEDRNDSYDNINSLMNNMENNEMLTYNLIYLSVIEPRIYQTLCDYCGVRLENNKLISTANNNKPIKEVASSNGYSETTIKKHIIIAANILKHDRTRLGKLIMQQEDYVVALLKGIFLSRSMTNENKRNFFSRIINLFDEKYMMIV